VCFSDDFLRKCKQGEYFDIFNCPRRLFHSHEKSGDVLQKEDVLEPYLAMLLICDLYLYKSESGRRKIYQ